MLYKFIPMCPPVNNRVKYRRRKIQIRGFTIALRFAIAEQMKTRKSERAKRAHREVARLICSLRERTIESNGAGGYEEKR